MTDVLKNTQSQIAVTFSAGDADGNIVHLTVTDADGVIVVNNALATHSTPAGRYTYNLPPQATVASLTAVWTGAFGGVTESLSFPIEIVGNVLFTLADLRAFGDAVLASTATYPDTTLADARSRVTELFERRCGVSFIPRYGRATVPGRYSATVWAPNRRITQILRVAVNDVALTAGELADLRFYPGGQIFRRNYFELWPGDTFFTSAFSYVGWNGDVPGNIVLSYEHGWTTPPQEIARCGMQLARYELTASQLADRFISMSNEFGVVRQAMPSEQNPTGIPIIDATLARYDETAPFDVY